MSLETLDRHRVKIGYSNTDCVAHTVVAISNIPISTVTRAICTQIFVDFVVHVLPARSLDCLSGGFAEWGSAGGHGSSLVCIVEPSDRLLQLILARWGLRSVGGFLRFLGIHRARKPIDNSTEHRLDIIEVALGLHGRLVDLVQILTRSLQFLPLL